MTNEDFGAMMWDLGYVAQIRNAIMEDAEATGALPCEAVRGFVILVATAPNKTELAWLKRWEAVQEINRRKAGANQDLKKPNEGRAGEA